MVIFTWLWARIAPYALGLGAFLAVLGTVFLRGRNAGTAALTEQIRKHNEKLETKFDEIDNRRPDLDASLERLRDRARRGRRSR